MASRQRAAGTVAVLRDDAIEWTVELLLAAVAALLGFILLLALGVSVPIAR